MLRISLENVSSAIRLLRMHMLQQCQTLYMDVYVRRIRHELGDTKLLAKLSEEDIVAI